MKKYFIFASFALFLFASKAEAKLIPFQAEEKNIQLNSQVSVKIEDFDQNNKNWVLDWDDDTSILKFYPSSKFLAYSLVNSDGFVLEYKILNTEDDWRVANSINAKKIVLNTDQNIQESENPAQVAINTQSIVNDNLKFSNTSYSTDNLVELSANQSLIISKVMAPISNGGLELISKFYQIPLSDNFNLKFVYQVDDFRSKSIYYYDFVNNQWKILPSYNDVEEKFLSAQVRNNQQELVVAIFADPDAKDGIASFYDQSRYRYFNYQNGNFAASRDYPKGTKLKVTRLKTGQSIIIEVNDYGPELQTGRIIDLDTEAFKKLSSLGAGLIYVKVEAYDQNN